MTENTNSSPQAKSIKACRQFVLNAGYKSITLYAHPDLQEMLNQLVDLFEAPKTPGRARAEILSKDFQDALPQKKARINAALKGAKKALTKRPNRHHEEPTLFDYLNIDEQ